MTTQYKVCARRYVNRAINSGWLHLATEYAATLGEANALAIELADTEGAEDITITRAAFGTPHGLCEVYYRRIDLCPVAWDGSEDWR